MITTYLSLGSNEGNRLHWLQQAQSMLNETCGIITKTSAIYETAAWGITAQPHFLNMAVELQTDRTPHSLLDAVLSVESRLGRQRSVKWGPRTLDIDILLYGHEIITGSELQVPHPYLHERRFTLLPLADIAPNYIHPKLHKSILQLLGDCPDTLEVLKFMEQ